MNIFAKYHTPRSIFYLAAELELNNLLEDQVRFAQYKSYYTVIFINARKAELAGIKLMPDSIQNISVSKEDRILMIPMVDELCFDFNDLKNYIRFTAGGNEELYQARIIAAGQSYYEEASHYKWSAVASMISAMALYISNNTTLLEADDNMPTTFPTQVTDDITPYSEKYSEYTTDKGDGKIGNSDKVDAENGFYEKIVAFNSDGIAIARGVKTFEERYTWSRNVTASGGRAELSGFKGDTTHGLAHLPLEANIYIVELDLNFQANAKGKFHSPAFAAGTYTIIITMEGYVPITLTEVEIKLHTTVTRHIVMVPLTVAEAAAKAKADAILEAAKATTETTTTETTILETPAATTPPPTV